MRQGDDRAPFDALERHRRLGGDAREPGLPEVREPIDVSNQAMRNRLGVGREREAVLELTNGRTLPVARAERR